MIEKHKILIKFIFKKITSKSDISRGCGASGFSPVSNIGIESLLISRSKYP